MKILNREGRWFERGVKESIYVKIEKPSLNRGGGLRFHLSPIYNAALATVAKRLNNKDWPKLNSKKHKDSRSLVTTPHD